KRAGRFAEALAFAAARETTALMPPESNLFHFAGSARELRRVPCHETSGRIMKRDPMTWDATRDKWELKAPANQAIHSSSRMTPRLRKKACKSWPIPTRPWKRPPSRDRRTPPTILSVRCIPIPSTGGRKMSHPSESPERTPRRFILLIRCESFLLESPPTQACLISLPYQDPAIQVL